MRRSSFDPACQFHTHILVSLSYLFDQSIVGTVIVSVTQDPEGGTRTHELPHSLILLYVYVLVQCVELILLAPNFRVLELNIGFLRVELSRSEVSACDVLAV